MTLITIDAQKAYEFAISEATRCEKEGDAETAKAWRSVAAKIVYLSPEAVVEIRNAPRY